jgi:predicted anti-sigma-YlaC factor YlaD
VRKTPIKCPEALALLQDYLKEELTPEHQLRVATHLAACGHCLGYAKFERNYLAAVERAARGVRCPEEVVGKVRRTLRSGESG